MAGPFVQGRTDPGTAAAVVLDESWQIELAGMLGARSVLKIKLDIGLDKNPGPAEIMRQVRAAGLTTSRRYIDGLHAIERRMAQLYAAYGLARTSWMGAHCDDAWASGEQARADAFAAAEKEAAGGPAADQGGVQPDAG